MKCPHCENKLEFAFMQTFVKNNLVLASDGSYITANVTCPHEGCEKDIELYYPLKEINGKEA